MTLANGAVIPNFMTFDSSSMNFNIFSTNVMYVNNFYEIVINVYADGYLIHNLNKF